MQYPVVCMPRDMTTTIKSLPFNQAITVVRKYFEDNGIIFGSEKVGFRSWFHDGCLYHQNYMVKDGLCTK